MYTIITNPASRSGGDQHRILKKLTDTLTSRGILWQVRYTENAGDPERIAAEVTEGCTVDDALIVIGGDGTINSVVNGVRDFSAVRFGFIPAGSANDLAKGLGIRDIARDPGQDENIRHIADGAVRRTIDLGEIHVGEAGMEAGMDTEDRKTPDGTICTEAPPAAETEAPPAAETDAMPAAGRGQTRLFAVSAGIGFDAAVCHESDASRARGFFNALHLGALTYGTIALKQLVTAPEARCDIVLDTGTEFHIGKLVFATFMNTPCEGGGYRFAPDAVPDDGQINVSAVGDLSKFTVLVNFPSAHKGTYYRVPGVYHARGSEIRVQTDLPLWVHTDGEVLGKYKALKVRTLPAKLRLLQ